MNELKVIGYIESCYLDKFGTPRQPGLVPDSFAKIIIHPEYQPEESLSGLEEFSHVWILFHFHQNTNHRFHAKVHPPRLLGETKGVFATRSPHRPNPIGLSLVKLEKIEQGILYVSGIDLVNKTPILDIKPYLPFVESIPTAFGGWADKEKVKPLSITFSEQAEEELKFYSGKNPQINLKQLIIDTLKQDPRPVVYRGYEDQHNSPYRSEHAVRIADYDVHFEFVNSDEVFVKKMLILQN